jgi:hypothetical protein
MFKIFCKLRSLKVNHFHREEIDALLKLYPEYLQHIELLEFASLNISI